MVNKGEYHGSIISDEQWDGTENHREESNIQQGNGDIIPYEKIGGYGSG